MDQADTILRQLRESGRRITKARRAIVRQFMENAHPVSASEMHRILTVSGIDVNVSTVYREIEFLKGEGIIREINIGDGKRRFERKPDNHHHHLICVRCESIECVELKGCLESEEEMLRRENGFMTISHSLEFHGICERCNR